MDLSEVISGGKNIDKIMENNRLNLASVVSMGGNISNGLMPLSVSSEEGTRQLSTINYNQYNYSPEALSKLEIYRQTRNQLTTLKGLV